MSILKKIKLNIKDKKVRQFRLFNIPIFVTEKDIKTNKVNFSFPFLEKEKSYAEKPDSQKPIFYLKMNRDFGYAFPCLQHWINIVNRIDADFYIICDKPNLELDILRLIKFKNKNIKFMKSNIKPLKAIAKTMASKGWLKAAYAHLTTFLHAKENNIQHFWNIDADDTTFVIHPDRCVEMLKQAEIYANKNNIDAFSFDMWNSRTKKQTWTFGITYTRMAIDWFSILKQNKDFSWTEKYTDCAYEWNLDYFFTHLKDTKRVCIEHFYFDNLYFIHWGDFVINIITSSICKFKDGKVIYPLISDVFKNETIGIIPIADDDIKLDLNITEEECCKFAFDFITNLRIYLPQTQKLWGIESICSKLETIE